MAHLTDIEGIGKAYAQKLFAAGIKTQEELLEACAKPSDRKKVAQASGISDKLVLKWANRADLARVKGVGEEYADLLELAGVDSVPELAHRNAANLQQRMSDINEQKHVVRKVPSVSQVEKWIGAAKGMRRAIYH